MYLARECLETGGRVGVHVGMWGSAEVGEAASEFPAGLNGILRR